MNIFGLYQFRVINRFSCPIGFQINLSECILLIKIPLAILNRTEFFFMFGLLDCLQIVLALMVVPTTITMASAYRALSNDYASWESLKDAVGISYNDVNGLYNDYWMHLSFIKITGLLMMKQFHSMSL